MLTTTSLLDWLSLRLTPEMTRPRFYNLMTQFLEPEAVYGAPLENVARVRGFDAQLARNVMANHLSDEVHRHAERLTNAGIKVISRNCLEYPINLSQSSLNPPLFFVKGTLTNQDRYSVALVGSRHATQYGRAVAKEFGTELAQCGMTVISGFARGIDGEAHNAALKAGGRTIAVLGNGLDICYPSEHRSLIEKVAASGALITEYPMGTPPDRYNFPERNHIIAALSLGTLVVEAAEKSGSLITARLALEENRFIFAVPGDITRNNSRGANSLIQQGARMVQRPREILVEMRHILRGYLNDELLDENEVDEEIAAKNRQVSRQEAVPSNDVPKLRTVPEKPEPPIISRDTQETQPISITPVAPAVMPEKNRSMTLGDAETFIVNLLRHEAMVFDELAVQAYGRGIDVAGLTSMLMKLELKSIIRQLPGRYYVLFAK